jgi:hypothetical protein
VSVSTGTGDYPAGANGQPSGAGAIIYSQEIMGANDNEKVGLPALTKAA